MLEKAKTLLYLRSKIEDLEKDPKKYPQGLLMQDGRLEAWKRWILVATC
jgi:hypothetical protein